jgi:hypothetical protein
VRQTQLVAQLKALLFLPKLVAWELSLEQFGRPLFRLCVVHPCLPFDTPVTTTQILRVPHFAQVVQ